MADYAKLSELESFTVTRSNGYKWKMYDEEQRKMLVSDSWQPGFGKRYSLATDQGTIEVSQFQLQSMLEGAYKDGISNIVGASFSVKTNGKTGKDIRYYINYEGHLQPLTAVGHPEMNTTTTQPPKTSEIESIRPTGASQNQGIVTPGTHEDPDDDLPF